MFVLLLNVSGRKTLRRHRHPKQIRLLDIEPNLLRLLLQPIMPAQLPNDLQELLPQRTSMFPNL
jgi:hypothetical protein